MIQHEKSLAGHRPPRRRLRRGVLAAGAAVAVILGGLGAAGAVSAPSARADAQGPCDIYAAGGTPCVAAHSTTRALYGAYDGALYQVRRASDNTTLNITPVAPGGIADSAAQDTFCAGTTCLITEIFDQSPNGNNLTQAPGGGAAGGPDGLANATQAPVLVGGQKVYGVYIAAGDGYRDDTTTGIATGDNPEGEYAIFDGSHYNGGCCFDYGNAETSNNDTGAGHMEAIYFGNIKVWGYGSGNGPWVMADLENGLFSGQAVHLNAGDPSITFPFVTAMVKGEPNQWAIRTGDSTTGALTTDYSGVRPTGYNPMHKEGAIILGIGGDNSKGSAGTFYEGVMTSGYPTDATEDAVQANIVAAGYKAIPIPLAPGPRVSIQATTPGYTNYYLKHDDGDDGLGIVPDTSLTTEAAKEDATFVETAPLDKAKTGCVSFESVNKPGSYLRHANFVLHLQAYDGSTLNAADGTFCPVAANSGQAGAVSFQSDNFPTKYLRHYNLVAYIASNGGTNAWDATASWAADTSWLVDAPLTATTTTLTWSPATPNGNNGYYTSAPSFSLDAEPADFATGIQYRIDGGAWTKYTGPVTIDQQGTHTVDYYSTSDVANNEQVQSATVNVDTVPPTATFSGTIGNVYFGSVPAAPTCTAADDTSGPAGCVVTGYDTSVGTHTLTATATDNAGNVGTAQETYTVLPWTFQGFYSPVQMAAVNTVGSGSTVPLKFQLFSNTTELTDPSLITMSGEKVDCTTQAPIAPITLASPGNTGLRYDPVAGQFIDNWKTPATPGACYTVTATSADGSSITAQYQLS